MSSYRYSLDELLSLMLMLIHLAQGVKYLAKCWYSSSAHLNFKYLKIIK